MSVVAGGGSQPPRGGDGNDPTKELPADKTAPTIASGKGKGKPKGGQSRAYDADEEQFDRDTALANHDNGTFPTLTYTWQDLTDAINNHNVGLTRTAVGAQQYSREERSVNGVTRHFRAWWREHTLAHGLIDENEDVSFSMLLIWRLAEY